MALDINQRTETQHTIITAEPARAPNRSAFFVCYKEEALYIIPSSHPLEAFKKRERERCIWNYTDRQVLISFSLVRLSLSYTFISFLSGYKMNVSRLFSVVY